MDCIFGSFDMDRLFAEHVASTEHASRTLAARKREHASLARRFDENLKQRRHGERRAGTSGLMPTCEARGHGSGIPTAKAGVSRREPRGEKFEHFEGFLQRFTKSTPNQQTRTRYERICLQPLRRSRKSPTRPFPRLRVTRARRMKKPAPATPQLSRPARPRSRPTPARRVETPPLTSLCDRDSCPGRRR